MLLVLFLLFCATMEAKQQYLNHVDFYPSEVSVYSEGNITVHMNEWIIANNISVFSVQIFKMLFSAITENGLPLIWDELASYSDGSNGYINTRYNTYVQVTRVWYFSDQIQTNSFQVTVTKDTEANSGDKINITIFFSFLLLLLLLSFV